MVFEKANTFDIEQLVRSRIDYLTEDLGEMSEDMFKQIREKLPIYYRDHLNKDFFAYVCRADGEIVSCCFLCVTEKPPSPSFLNGKTGTVLNVYTKPEYRRQGIAGKLLKMLLSDAENAGLDLVELKATDAGYSLYKSLGFEELVSKYRNMKYVFEKDRKSYQR